MPLAMTMPNSTSDFGNTPTRFARAATNRGRNLALGGDDAAQPVGQRGVFTLEIDIGVEGARVRHRVAVEDAGVFRLIETVLHSEPQQVYSRVPTARSTWRDQWLAGGSGRRGRV